MCRVRVLLEWVKDKGEARFWRAYTGVRRSFGGGRREFCLGKPLGGLGGFWLGLARVFTAQTRYKKSGLTSGFFGRVSKCIYTELGERGFGMGVEGEPIVALRTGVRSDSALAYVFSSLGVALEYRSCSDFYSSNPLQKKLDQ